MSESYRGSVEKILYFLLKEHPDLLNIVTRNLHKLVKDDLEKRKLRLPAIFSSLVNDSKSQLSQDLFVLSRLNFKRSGFFVEVGASDGITLSNTWMLEQLFGWRGVLVEPAKVWHESIKSNRTSIIDKRCVWETSGLQLSFSQAREAELSTLSAFKDSDNHRVARADSEEYFVETVSLEDLLVTHGAPESIDYLSLDTEGSEFTILKSFDFDRFSIKVITVEHNFTNQRSAINELLASNGYRQVLSEISEWDDWYVHSSLS
jgi:FkbM family methyltransferase